MDTLENVFVGEVLILQHHENGDPHSDRSRGGSELLRSADVFQSEL